MSNSSGPACAVRKYDQYNKYNKINDTDDSRVSYNDLLFGETIHLDILQYDHDDISGTDESLVTYTNLSYGREIQQKILQYVSSYKNVVKLGSEVSTNVVKVASKITPYPSSKYRPNQCT